MIMACKRIRIVSAAVVVLVLAGGVYCGSWCVNEEEEVYMEAFAWEITGASVEEVWRITGNFVQVDKWIGTLLKASYLVAGVPQQPGCVRKAIVLPMAEGQPFTYIFEKLLTIDEHQHNYSYALLNTTTPGFSLLRNYTSFVKVSPLTAEGDVTRTLFQWRYVTGAASNLSAAEVHDILYGSLFSVALSDLQKDLSLPTGSIILISGSSNPHRS